MIKKISNKFTLKSYPWQLIFYPFGLALFVLVIAPIFSFFSVLPTEGDGVVLEMVNRGGHVKGKYGEALPEGIFAKLDNGSEIIITPLSGQIKKGMYIKKSKWSLTYELDGLRYPTFLIIITKPFKLAKIVFVFFLVALHFLWFVQTKEVKIITKKIIGTYYSPKF